MSGTIHVERHGAHVALLEIDNPPLNVMGSATRVLLLDVLEGLQNDTEIRAMVLTGRGRAFCSGDDLREKDKRTEAGREGFAALLDAVEAPRAPVIAAINGWCVGGGLELALCCDIRIAATTAKFTAAGVNVGLMASVYRLPRLIGTARAKAMILTGLPHDAATAERYGLVTAIHEPEDLRGAALALAGQVAARAPLSVEAAKRFMARAPDLSPDEAAKLYADELRALNASQDHQAALAAFRDKRDPVFERK